MSRSTFQHRRVRHPTGALISADSFNRVTGAAPGSTDGAGSADPLAWVASVTAPNVPFWKIFSNGVEYNSVTVFVTPFDSALHVPLGVADMDVSIDLTRIGSNGVPALVFRYVDFLNFWRWAMLGTAGGGYQWTLVKRVAGVETTLAITPIILPGSAFGGAGAPNHELTMRVVAHGNLILCFLNDIIIFDVTDAALNTATSAGIYSNAPAFDVFDRWQANVPLL